MMPPASQSLRLPVRTCSVSVSLLDGELLKGELCLRPVGLEQFESVLDLLNGPDEFLPIRGSEGGGARLVSKRALRWVEVREPSGTDLKDEDCPPEQAPVRVHLQDGEAIHGSIFYHQPANRARVLDFLNCSPRFFPLDRGEKVTIVHKLHVAYVEHLLPDR
jgi:hypothetical protein